MDHHIQTRYDYRFQVPIVITDANGNMTATRLDNLGRAHDVTLPECAGAATVKGEYGDFAFVNSGQPYYERLQQRIDDCTGNADYSDTTVFYDGLGRKIQAQAEGDIAGQTIISNVEYDELGRVTRNGMPYVVSGNPGIYQTPSWLSGETNTSYDPLGRTLVASAPDGTETRYFYGTDGLAANNAYAPTNLLLTAITDGNGHAKHQVSDSFGRLIRVRDFTGTSLADYEFYAETKYTYDERDNLTQVQDTAENLTKMTYDILNRKIKMDDPDMGTWHYTYDPLGNLTRQTDHRDTVTTFTYDNLNRPKAHTYSDGTPTVTFDYDQGLNALGRQTQMTDLNGAGQVNWTYDARGRLLRETRTFSGPYASLANTQDGGAYITSHTYNAADWPTSLTYPDGEVVATSYTRRGLANGLTGSDTYIQNSTYNALAQMTERVAGNGLATVYSYYTAQQDNNRLKRIQVGELLDIAYDNYDAVGNITQMTDYSTSIGGQTLAFGYDHLDRLIDAQATGGLINGYIHSYAYDALGNIDHKIIDGVLQDYTYPASGPSSIRPHAVSQVGNDTYTYDANGNMTIPR